MLNVDERLFTQVDSKEFFLLSRLAARMGKDRKVWPSNQLLMEETGWSIETLQKVKASLAAKKLIAIDVRKSGKRQTSNCYHIQTPLISKYKTDTGKTSTAFEAIPENQVPGVLEKPTPPDTGKTDTPQLSIDKKEVLNNELRARPELEKLDYWVNRLNGKTKKLKDRYPELNFNDELEKCFAKYVFTDRIKRDDLTDFSGYLASWMERAKLNLKSTQQKPVSNKLVVDYSHGKDFGSFKDIDKNPKHYPTKF